MTVRPPLVILIALCAATASADDGAADFLEWSSLPRLPEGVSGTFAGVANGSLIVAGGANFPTRSPFEGGSKVWYWRGYVLPENGEAWSEFALPRSTGYGVSATTSKGLVCVGGGDADSQFRDAFLLNVVDGVVTRRDLPSAPQPCGFGGGAALGDAVYVVGGQSSPGATGALDTFWRLDLSNPEADWHWEELEPCPGAPRILPVVVAQAGRLYVVSGATLSDDDGQAARAYLTDAHAFDPASSTWTRLADVPRPVVAGTGVASGDQHLLVFSGDDGVLAPRAAELKDDHPGFPREVLAYETVTDTWRVVGSVPEGLVTTNAVPWTVEGESVWVIPGGEDRPGHRSASVFVAKPTAPRASFGLLDYGVLVVYLLGMVGIGLYFARGERGTDDFFLAGRRIPWWAAGLSIFGTQLSAITFMAIPAAAFATNWVTSLFNLGILLVAPLVVFGFLPYFRGRDITTAYEYLEQRFGLPLRWFGSLSFVVFQLGRMGIVLFLPSLALATVTGVNVYACILVMGVLCTVYTVLGGIEAVVWTDVIQAFVLGGGAIVSLAVMANGAGGLAGIVETGRTFDKFETFVWTPDLAILSVWVIVLGGFFNNLVPYCSDQTVIQRYLTTRDESAAARAVWTNAALTVPATILFFLIGTALFAFYRTHPELLNPAARSDDIFPWFIANELPSGLAGLVIAGLFAATMSSVDSSMNSISATVVTDFVRRTRPDLEEASYLRLARSLTVLLGVVAITTASAIAFFEIRSLWSLFIGLVGLLGGSLAGIFLLGIGTRRATQAGTFVGAVAGIAAQVAVARLTSLNPALYGAVGIVTCCVVGYVASLLRPVPGD